MSNLKPVKTPPAAASTPAAPGVLRRLGVTAMLIGIGMVVAWGLSLAVGGVYAIEQHSMSPTLEPADKVFALRPHLHDPAVGDIVILTDPDGGGPAFLIKRVVATQGDEIEARQGRVWVNGSVLDEPYLGAGMTTSDFGPYRVGDGQLFVLGDNRPGSLDSRTWGGVPGDLIVGTVIGRLWPAPGGL